MESTEDVCKALNEKKTEAQQKIKSIEEQISYWKKGVKESEENLRDMVSQRRDK